METKDYSKFIFLSYNRPISQKHVDELIELIKKNGYLPGQRIRISKRFEIIDGQHRFLALKALGMEIEYEFVCESATPELIGQYNIGLNKWSTSDEINKIANTTNASYKRLVDAVNENNTTMCQYVKVFSSCNRVGQMNDIVNGNYQITAQQILNANIVFREINEIKKLYKHATKSYFISAYCKALQISGFSGLKFINALENSHMEPCGNTAQCCREIERVWNRTYKKNQIKIDYK